jgi:dCMP deaminase
MRISRDEWGLELAKVTARRGTCCRRQVGCVLVDKDGHVLSTGYNGVAAGLPHCNSEQPMLHLDRSIEITYPNACAGAKSPSGTNLDSCQAIHAEQNALLQCKDVREVHTCYVTCSPCVTCVKLLMNTGCRRIVFGEVYPHSDAKNLWLLTPGREWHLVVGGKTYE